MERTLDRLNNRNALQFNKEGGSPLFEEHTSLMEQQVCGPNCLHAGWNSVSVCERKQDGTSEVFATHAGL